MRFYKYHTNRVKDEKQFKKKEFNRLWIMLKLLLLRRGEDRAAFLKKKNVFASMGKNCFWHPKTIPSEPQLLTLHNNVNVASDVYFCTHDILHILFNNDPELQNDYEFCIGNIELMDNTFIGAKSIIMYNVKIGPNAIVAAGSVVTKDVPEGVVVAGNPARIIGSYENISHKRRKVKT